MQDSDAMMKSKPSIPCTFVWTTRFLCEPSEWNHTLPRITFKRSEIERKGIFPNMQVIVRSKKKSSAFNTTEFYAWMRPIDAEKVTHFHYTVAGEMPLFHVTTGYKRDIGHILKTYNIFITVMMLNNSAVFSNKKKRMMRKLMWKAPIREWDTMLQSNVIYFDYCRNGFATISFE